MKYVNSVSNFIHFFQISICSFIGASGLFICWLSLPWRMDYDTACLLLELKRFQIPIHTVQSHPLHLFLLFAVKAFDPLKFFYLLGFSATWASLYLFIRLNQSRITMTTAIMLALLTLTPSFHQTHMALDDNILPLPFLLLTFFFLRNQTQGELSTLSAVGAIATSLIASLLHATSVFPLLGLWIHASWRLNKWTYSSLFMSCMLILYPAFLFFKNPGSLFLNNPQWYLFAKKSGTIEQLDFFRRMADWVFALVQYNSPLPLHLLGDGPQDLSQSLHTVLLFLGLSVFSVWVLILGSHSILLRRLKNRNDGAFLACLFQALFTFVYDPLAPERWIPFTLFAYLFIALELQMLPALGHFLGFSPRTTITTTISSNDFGGKWHPQRGQWSLPGRIFWTIGALLFSLLLIPLIEIARSNNSEMRFQMQQIQTSPYIIALPSALIAAYTSPFEGYFIDNQREGFNCLEVRNDLLYGYEPEEMCDPKQFQVWKKQMLANTPALWVDPRLVREVSIVF